MALSSRVKFAFLHVFILVGADNPLVANVGMADPHIHVFDDKAYLYTGRDLSPTDTGFRMPDWNIWSSSDLVHWSHEVTITPNQTYIGNIDDPECWAADVGFRNGVYSYFFSDGRVNKSLGVMQASVPTLADAVDELKAPLVSMEDVGNLTRPYDPTVLIDDDAGSTPYLCFGVHQCDNNVTTSWYLIAKLDDSMQKFAEVPRKVIFLANPTDGSQMPSDDKSTLHKRNGIYYLSAGSMYSTASSVYGPYTFRGDSNPSNNQIRTFGLTTQAHGRFWTWRNQWFHVWCQFVFQNNTDDIMDERVSQPRPYARWRDSWMTYVHYRSNGEMVDDYNFLELHGATGVGQYDAAWTKIEAEWYMAANGTEKLETEMDNTSFAVRFSAPGASLWFPNVAQLPTQGILTLGLALNSSVFNRAGDGEVVVLSTSTGERLAICSVRGEDNSNPLVTCPFRSSRTTDDLSFVYSDTVAAGGVTLDWWSISHSPEFLLPTGRASLFI